MHVFITGTDTGVGKTYVTARIIRGLRARGVDAVGFKPLCCGSRDDAEALRAASGDALSLNEVNPVWLRAPAAPYAAAMIENRAVDLDAIHETFARLHERHASVIVEGVGGWLVPIRRDYTVADLAAGWKLPVVVVAANRLGALNHTALTVQAVRAAGLPCAGVILNDLPPSVSPRDSGDEHGDLLARTTNGGVLADWLQVPILAIVGTGQADISIDLSKLSGM